MASAANDDQVYEFGPFRLDPVERLLLRDGDLVPLTPKAFDLITDPKEEYPATALRNTWNARPAMDIVVEFEKSLKKYPQIAPGGEATDKIIILEDPDHTGKATKSTVFAEGLLLPTGVAPR